jgi:hypothetical protein
VRAWVAHRLFRRLMDTADLQRQPWKLLDLTHESAGSLCLDCTAAAPTLQACTAIRRAALAGVSSLTLMCFSSCSAPRRCGGGASRLAMLSWRAACRTRGTWSASGCWGWRGTQVGLSWLGRHGMLLLCCWHLALGLLAGGGDVWGCRCDCRWWVSGSGCSDWRQRAVGPG